MKKIYIFSCLLFFLGAFTCAAYYEPQYEKNYADADAELNRVYNEAIEKIKQDSIYSDEIKNEWIEQQRKAQRIWIEFRDADAEVVEYDWLGGSGMGLAKTGWKQLLTEHRIKELKERYSIE